MGPKNGMGIASMVLGIVSVSLSAVAIPIGIFFQLWGCFISVCGILCGIVAIALGAKSKNLYPAGQAIAGFVMGIVGVSIHTIIFLCFLLIHIYLR